MSKGNLLTKGAQGKNFDYQFNVLRVLGLISTGVAPPIGGLATEATALLILNAIATTQDIEILLVRDSVTDIVYKQVVNYSSGTPTVTYEDVNGNPFVPVNPMVYLDPSSVLNLMLTEILDQGTTLDSIDITITALNAKFNILGQKASAGSTPVVLSTEQEAIITSIQTLLTGISRTPSVVTAIANGNTIAGVKGLALWFRGPGGTLGGQPVPNGARFSYGASDNNDTVAALAYTIPTGGAQEIIITYLT